MAQDCSNYDSSGGVDGKALGGSGGSRIRSGIEIQTGNPSIGSTNPTVSFYLNQEGSPTGDVTVRVYQGDVLVKTGSSVDSSSLVVKPNVSAYEFTINDYTIAADDRIVLTWTPAGGTSPQVNVRTSNSASYDSSYDNKAVEYKDDGTGWNVSNLNSWWCYGTGGSTTSQVFIPPPPAQVSF